jgi:hypothetical protein
MKAVAVATGPMVPLPRKLSRSFYTRGAMARIQYDIVPIAGGWQVNCNGRMGTPYSGMSDAVQDTLATAEQLRKQGETVEVRLLQLDGTRRVLEPRDARLYPRG